jgi:cysteine desulfurase
VVVVYLDANATEPVRPAARLAADAAAGLANPSSIHAAGRAARKCLEDARESVAAALAARPGNVIFCSGATEANALAIHALGAGRPVFRGATEHDAVRAAAPDAAVIPVLRDGTVDLQALAATLPAGALVCLMAANNETGVVHDIAGAAEICAAAGASLHVDAAQAAGRRREDWFAMGVSSLAISGHKMGGIPGAGALILARDVPVAPDLRGGGQEQGRRGGTPALPAIAAMAAALREPYDAAAIAGWRDEIETFAVARGAVVIGAGVARIANTTCLAVPGVAAHKMLIALDLAGVCVSAGAACSSGKLAASHVVAAMGFPELAGCAIRVSLPWNASAEMVRLFCDAFEKTVARLHPAPLFA